ncbi:MAG: hypothetical protein IKF52_05935 [Clostridia bacterium]|nr:hypothetical protein [Clostridia bacterium]
MLIPIIIVFCILVPSVYYSLNASNGDLRVSTTVYTLELSIILIFLGKQLFDIYNLGIIIVAGIVISFLMKKMWKSYTSEIIIFLVFIILAPIIQFIVWVLGFMISFTHYSPI